MNEIKSLVDSVYFREIQILKILIIKQKNDLGNFEEIQTKDKLFVPMETQIIKKWFSIQLDQQTHQEFVTTFIETIFNYYKKIFSKYDQAKIDSQEFRQAFIQLKNSLVSQAITARIHLSNLMLQVVQFSRERLKKYIPNEKQELEQSMQFFPTAIPLIFSNHHQNSTKNTKNNQLCEFSSNLQNIKIYGLTKQLHSTKFQIHQPARNSVSNFTSSQYNIHQVIMIF